MRYMFTMMNNARLSVGLEGLALAERAYQMAARLRQGAQAGPGPGRAGGRAVADHRPPRRAADAPHHAGVDRGAARDHLRQRGRHRPRRRATPTRPRAPAARSWPTCSPRCRRGGAPTSASSSPASPSRCTAAWATSRRPASPSTSATPASPRSTRAPTASRPWTSSAASSRCGRRCRRRLPRLHRGAPSTELAAAGDELASIRTALADGARRAAHRHRLAPGQRAGRPARRPGRRHALPAAVQRRHRRLGDGPAGAEGHRRCWPTPRRPTRRSTRARCSPPGSSASSSSRRPPASSRPSPPPTGTSRPPSSRALRAGRGRGRRGSCLRSTTRLRRW